MARRTEPMTAAEERALHAHKMHCHRHNALYGSTKMASSQMRAIASSPSTTIKAQNLATEIELLLEMLGQELYNNRIELDGSLVHPRHRDQERLDRWTELLLKGRA